MSSLVERLTESQSSSYWVEFQNNLWEYVYKAKHSKMMQILENTSLYLPYLGNPNQTEIIERSLRNCLQTLLYITWLERSNQHELVLAENILIDIRESYHVLYWAVLNRSAEFQPGFLMTNLIIEKKHNLIAKNILDVLMQTTSFQPLLSDGVCILHLAIVVGHKLEKSDESVDLISNFLIKSPTQVEFTCPWTGKSSLDFALEHGLDFQSKQLYILGCRASTNIDEESELTKEIFRVRIPSGESGNAFEGMLKFSEVLEKWRNDEYDLIKELNENIVGNEDLDKEGEFLILEKVTNWLENKMNEKQMLPFPFKLRTSGSFSEKTKIRPLDEIDFIIQCSLDIELRVSDENSIKDWMNNNALDYSTVEKELAKIDSKQPFPYLAKVILAADYPGLGDAGDILEPERFSNIMKDFVLETLNETNLPEGIYVPQGKNFLEQTKSGFFMNLEYENNDAVTQELTIDLVSVITLSQEKYELVLCVMPKYDKNKFKYLKENNLISMNDGIIVKNGNWRMSFSNSERKIIRLHPDLYRALKYLNKVSEHHIDIPTYYLKEIFCSYIVHQGMT